jgi:FixJ family two-component response regulator
MSGYAQDVPLGPDSKLDGMEFLQKPFGAEALAEALRTALAESQPVPDGGADSGTRPTA